MAAAGPPPLFSRLYGDATLWENPNPDYDLICSTLGYSAAATCLTAPNARSGLVNLSVRSPIAAVFMSRADGDHIYVAHSLTMFPSDLTQTTPMDGLMVGLVGNNASTVAPVVLPGVFHTNVANTLCKNITAILANHGMAPVVYRDGPHAAGAPDTDDLRARPVMVVPPDLAHQFISGADDGRYSLNGFYNQFLAGPLASGDAAVIARWTPLVEWYRVASTNAAAGDSVVANDLTNVATPHATGRLMAWANRVKDAQMARLGVGGPQLSNAAFAHGVTSLQATLVQNHDDRLRVESDLRNKSFSDKHGDALGMVMHRLTNVHSDADMPPVHALLLKTPKALMYSMLNGLFQQRAASSIVPLTHLTAPLATTKLVDGVFRAYQPGGDGLEFAKGLSPFAIMGPGHEGCAALMLAVKQAQLIEQSASVSLSDATALLTEDTQFPTEPFVAVEKIYGWSVVLDVFHGINHPVALSVSSAVCQLGPLLQRMASQMGDSARGMELICRVLFELQQDYFLWLGDAASGKRLTEGLDFSKLISMVATHRADCLSPLPASWYLLTSCPKKPVGQQLPVTAPRELREPPGGPGAPGSRSVSNTHADQALVRRFSNSGHSTISAMIGGRTLDYPKHSGKAVCMSWALKGACNTNCKRVDQHVRYSAATNRAIGELMTQCGVANAQP